MEGDEKIVYFGIYCRICEYCRNKEFEDPCRNCLNHETNVDSHKPVYFKEKDKE